jgi:PAS domain S-box-containing protein
MRLRTKILLFYFPLTLLSMGGMTLFAQFGVQHIVEQGVAKRGASVASGAAQDSEMISGFRERNETQLLPLLQTILMQTQALHAIALDSAGQVLAHTNVGERGKVYQDPLTVEALKSPEPLSRRTRSVEDQPVMDVLFPIWDHLRMPDTDEAFLLTGLEKAAGQRRLGTLRIGLPLREELETGDNISSQIFWIITVGSSLVLALILLFTGRILHPIRLLVEASERLGRGEWGGQVDARSGDEIGDLARSFNRMSEDLARTTVSKDFLDSILANMQDALLVTTAEGKILTVNRSAQSLLGYPETDLQKRHIIDLLALDALAHSMTNFEKLVRENTFQNLRGHAVTQTADRVPVLVSASAIADPQNITASFIITVHDISDWEQAEMARQEAEQQLEEQKALSIRSDRLRSLGEMAAGIAHELNQPLVGVRGITEHILLSLERNWDLSHEKLRQRLERIMEQADRMVHIIQHVRLFAREAGKPNFSSVQVNEIVHSVLDLLAVQTRTHGIELGYQLTESLPTVRVNPYSLEEALINLLNNARDAVEEKVAEGKTDGQGRVLVHTNRAEEQDTEYVRIEIEDNGPGIPDEILEQVFDPFFTTKDPEKGTGLGLAISRAIIEEFGGQIRIHTTPGQGTTMAVLLPCESSFADPDSAFAP